MSDRPLTRTKFLPPPPEHKPSKDASGAYEPEPPRDLSIDGLLLKGLEAIERTMTSILKEAKAGRPSRESIQSLKDCMGMLKDLKDKESELLDELTEEELKTLSTKK